MKIQFQTVIKGRQRFLRVLILEEFIVYLIVFSNSIIFLKSTNKIKLNFQIEAIQKPIFSDLL